MAYPLEPGKPADYPVHPGSMLLTLVEPHKGYEVAFNRWYERDHFYGGCMEGEFNMAGARWVATRDLKDLRFPKETDAAKPNYDSGSYIAVYWVLAGHHDEWLAWSGKRVFELYSGGRGFPERSHVNTNLYSFLGADYRDEDPVPVMLALDRHYQGMIVMWFDGMDGAKPAESLAKLREKCLPEMLKGSKIEIAATWAPFLSDEPRSSPMDLGAGPGGPTRFCQLMFTDSDPKESIDTLKAYADAAEQAGIAKLSLCAPFKKTIVGTDTYADQLW